MRTGEWTYNVSLAENLSVRNPPVDAVAAIGKRATATLACAFPRLERRQSTDVASQHLRFPPGCSELSRAGNRGSNLSSSSMANICRSASSGAGLAHVAHRSFVELNSSAWGPIPCFCRRAPSSLTKRAGRISGPLRTRPPFRLWSLNGGRALYGKPALSIAPP